MAIRSKTTQKTRSIGIVIGVIIIGTVLSVIPPVKNSIIQISNAPITAITQYTKQIISKKQSKDLSASEIEIKNLKTKLDKLGIQNAQMEHLKQENIILREELELKKKWNYQTISAELITKDPALPEAMLIVNKGALSGVKTGDIVTHKGVFIGKIVKVLDNISWIRLLNHPESKVAVYVAGKDGKNGILKGNAGLSLTVELIPQSIEVNENDIVLSSIIDDSVLPDLVIGKVSGVTAEEGGLFQKLTLLPLVNYRSVRVVTIIKELSEDTR